MQESKLTKLMIDPAASYDAASRLAGEGASSSPATPRTPPLVAEHKGETKGDVKRSPKSPHRSVDKPDEEAGGIWQRYRELLVHLPLARRGLMVAKVKGMGKTSFADAGSLTVGSRILFFDQPKEECPNSHKQEALLKQIEKFYDADYSKRMMKIPAGKKGEAIERALMAQAHCSSLTAKLIREYTGEKGRENAEEKLAEDVIYNRKRRDEVFLPFVIKDADSWTKFYIYPWLSQNNGAFKFGGFKQFVVAVCMFGAGFRGQCQNNTEFTLIKHFIPFFPEQRVVSVFFEEELTRNYENYIFSQLKNLSAYIQTHTKADQPKKLVCHMPYYDYILFCVELFLRGRMSLAVLGQSIDIILQKKYQYSQAIRKICAAHQVDVHIVSPFNLLFQELEELEDELLESSAESGDNRLAKAFLNRLGISCEEVDLGKLSKEKETESEKNLVQKCLAVLCANKSPSHVAQRIWSDFVKSNKTEVATLEDLFKIANAVIVAMSTEGMGNYETLVWELLTEKQIQVSYSDFSRAAKYPAVVNFTVLDPGIIYTRTNGGNLFYQERHAHSQKSLMRRWPLISQLAAQQQELSVDKVKEILSAAEKDPKIGDSPQLTALSNPTFGPSKAS